MLSENSSPVSLRVAGSVIEISLNRPPANALGLPIIDGLKIGLDAADALPAKVIVVSSALPGFFAAGADIKHMATIDAESFAAYGKRMRAVNDRLAAAPWLSIAVCKPVMISGPSALAGGLSRTNSTMAPSRFQVTGSRPCGCVTRNSFDKWGIGVRPS